jgi:hypothetical protein
MIKSHAQIGRTEQELNDNTEISHPKPEKWRMRGKLVSTRDQSGRDNNVV